MGKVAFASTHSQILINYIRNFVKMYIYELKSSFGWVYYFNSLIIILENVNSNESFSQWFHTNRIKNEKINSRQVILFIYRCILLNWMNIKIKVNVICVLKYSHLSNTYIYINNNHIVRPSSFKCCHFSVTGLEFLAILKLALHEYSKPWQL